MEIEVIEFPKPLDDVGVIGLVVWLVVEVGEESSF